MELRTLFSEIEDGEVFFPYRTREDIISLKSRANAYFHPITKDLHFGIYRPSPNVCNWIYRKRLGVERYEQRSLMVALEGGVLVNSLSDAFEEFNRYNVNVGVDESRRGRVRSIYYCPISSSADTFGKILLDYCDWLQVARSKSTHYGAVVLLNYHIIPYFANMQISELRSRHLVEVAKRIYQTPPKHGFVTHVCRDRNIVLSDEDLMKRKRTFNSIMTHLRGSLRYAADNGVRGALDASSIVKNVSVNTKPKIFFLNITEVRKVLDNCAENLKNIALGALYSGCRVGELARLTVGDVGCGGFGLRVPAFKRGAGRFVFLSEDGMNFFQKIIKNKDKADLVFTTVRGKKWRKHHVVPFQEAVRAAGVSEKFTFHGLRHTYASYLLMSGVSLEVVAKQLGHKSILTTVQTYGHLSDSFREQEVRSKFSFSVGHSAHLLNCDRPFLSEAEEPSMEYNYFDTLV